MARPARAMRHVLVSGGTGMVGRFVVERLIADGAAVSVLGRTPPPAGFFSRPVRFHPGRLDPAAADPDDFSGVEAFVHAAFDHLPGRFRGGEGSDPAGFRARNVEGSSRLFEAACRAGVARIEVTSNARRSDAHAFYHGCGYADGSRHFFKLLGD